MKNAKILPVLIALTALAGRTAASADDVMRVNGSVTRAIGRRRSEASPVKNAVIS